MNENDNPYRAPTQQVPSFWSFLTSWFRFDDLRFKNGAPLVHDGIAFFVETDNLSDLFAASPTKEVSSERMKLVIEEVKRVFPDFLRAHSALFEFLQSRKIAVRLIHSYEQLAPLCDDVPLTPEEKAILFESAVSDD